MGTDHIKYIYQVHTDLEHIPKQTELSVYIRIIFRLIQFLMLITDVCLFGFSVGLKLVLIETLCLFRSPVGVTGLILVIWILYLYYETHTSISELILIRKYP